MWPAEGMGCTELMQLPAAREMSGSTPWRSKARTAARAAKNCPVRFTASTCCHCAAAKSYATAVPMPELAPVTNAF
jgi:hypothetical protein